VLAQDQPGRRFRRVRDARDVHALAAQRVAHEPAERVVAEPPDPRRLVTEASQADRDVRLRAGERDPRR
jgi:hypothetical protein